MRDPLAIVALTFADGSVGRMQYFGKEPVQPRRRADGTIRQPPALPPLNERIQAEINKSQFFQGAPVSWRVVTMNDFPVAAHDFRDAWRDNGTTIGVQMPRARLIHMARIRRMRDRKLAALDTDQLKAIAENDTATVAAIEAQKQTLRDLPQTFDLAGANTPAELRALWPAQVDRPD